MSEADKDRVHKDLPGLVKQLLEKQGHQVRKVVVAPEVEKLLQAAVAKGGAAQSIRPPDVVPALLAHIVYPAVEKCLWILVN